MTFRLYSGLIAASFLILGWIPAKAGEMHWLKNDHLEAGFTWEEGIRLAVLRIPGGENFLRVTDDPYHGLKTWVMAPTDILALRDMLSEQPASLDVVNSREIRLRTCEPNEWGLVLEWIVTLETEAPSLKILQRIHNEGEKRPYLGVWSLAAIPAEATFRVPFARSPHRPKDYPNNIAVFPYTDIQDNRIRSTRKFLELEIREGEEEGSVKLGLVQSQGRVTVARHGSVLEFSAPYAPDADYPEGGSNVTLYASPANRSTTMGEVEHMGPLEVVAPGESIELPVRITMTSNRSARGR